MTTLQAFLRFCPAGCPSSGIIYRDVESYKPIDVVEVKPFLFKTEFVPGVGL
jgi:hypothetical protein